MLKAVKIRIYPSEEQANYIARLLGTCRFTYNSLLAHKIAAYNQEKKTVTFGQLGKKLTSLKEEFPWMREVHSKPIQQSVINLEYAYKNFFRNGMGFPRFKSRHDNSQSCRFPADAFGGIVGNRITLVKALKDIHFRCSTRDEKYLNKNQDNIRSTTLSRTPTGKYFLSILIDGPFAPRTTEPKHGIVGIDLGIKDFITTSRGERFENLKLIRTNQRRLSLLQRGMSRKVKGSNNRKKARIKLARLHERLSNKKENYLHSIVNRLLDENQVIAVENLNVKGMMANHKLARSIQKLSINRFGSILIYKAAWMGRDIIEVDRYFPSSKLCSECGWKNDELQLRDREWVCAECGVVHDRDLNAAVNIEQEGGRLIKIGSSSPESTPLERPIGGALKKEKNVILGLNAKI